MQTAYYGSGSGAVGDSTWTFSINLTTLSIYPLQQQQLVFLGHARMLVSLEMLVVVVVVSE